MSLIEMVLAIVIIGVGLAGVVVAFSTAVRASADPLIHKQMLAIAEEMMEEIALKPYAIAANVAPGGCARSTFNDIRDYNNYATSGICHVDGTALPTLAGYDIAVQVQQDNLLPNIANGDALRITITVTHGLLNTVTLESWRTNY